MIRITAQFETDNDAFAGEDYWDEIDRVLDQIRDKARRQLTAHASMLRAERAARADGLDFTRPTEAPAPLRDVNGNTIGTVRVRADRSVVGTD